MFCLKKQGGGWFHFSRRKNTGRPDFEGKINGVSVRYLYVNQEGDYSDYRWALRSGA